MDPIDSREEAARIAGLITPIIAHELGRRPVRERLRFVADPDLTAAADAVADAVTLIDERKFTGAERLARIALEKKARVLKRVLERLRR